MAWASFFLSRSSVCLFALVAEGRGAAAWWLRTMLAHRGYRSGAHHEVGPRFETVRAPSRRRPAGARLVVAAFMAVIIAFLPVLSRR